MKKRNELVYLLTGCVLTASMSVGTMATVHAEAEITSTAAVEPGTNMYAAGELTLNTPVSGTSENAEDYHWYSFTTGAEAGVEYQISCVNATPNTNQVYFGIYDANSEELYSGEALSDGKPSTILASDLQPDTTYYIRVVSAGSTAAKDYILMVKAPKADDKKAASADGGTAADVQTPAAAEAE